METNEAQVSDTPKWCPLDRIERRVLGVLIEKSKTTPGQYPMTLNAITTGCNQKSNRKPSMQLDADDVQLALDNLRSVGAVIEILGDGRTAKYKHLGYKWMGVDKGELAVMAELLLRGEQTLGDLRARVARMHPLKNQAELVPIVQSLIEKNLIVELTPPGRGQLVTHNLYLPEQLEKVRRGIAPQASPDAEGAPSSQPCPSGANPAERSTATGADTRSPELVARIDALEKELAQLRSRLDSIEEILK